MYTKGKRNLCEHVLGYVTKIERLFELDLLSVRVGVQYVADSRFNAQCTGWRHVSKILRTRTFDHGTL